MLCTVFLSFYLQIVLCCEVLSPHHSFAFLPSLSSRTHPGLDRVLLTTEAPFHTPQNITDTWIRDGRNEPCNFSFVLPNLADLFAVSEAEVALQLLKNAVAFYGFVDPPERAEGEGEDAAVAAAAAKGAEGEVCVKLCLKFFNRLSSFF